MPNSLLVGEDKLVADWVFGTHGLVPVPIAQAIGILDKSGKLVGGILLHNYNGSNGEVSYYGYRTFSVGIFRAIARMGVAYNVARCTVVTSKRNKRLIRALIKLGFGIEGTQRCYFGREDCTKSTGVRLVMFRHRIDEIADPKRPFRKGE